MPATPTTPTTPTAFKSFRCTDDPEIAQHWDRVMEGKKHTTFKITTKIVTAAKDNIDGNTEKNDLSGLDTNANRHEGQSI
jgi:hypothetical protein